MGEGELDYVTNTVCNERNRYDGRITDEMLCAGFPNVGKKDACQGDSGGPLVMPTVDASNNNNRVVDVIVGVVSWGFGCGSKKYPGVYSRITSGIDWIVPTACNELNSDADFCPSPKEQEPPPPEQPAVCDGPELVVTVKTDD